MSKNGIDKRSLQKFFEDWDDLIRAVPEAKKAALTVMGEVFKQEVDAQIIAQGVDDSFGHVRAWQEVRIGSGGGYGVLSPRKGTVRDRFGRTHTRNGRSVTAKQVTRWLERGHGTRKSLYSGKRRWSREVDWSRVDSRTGLVFVPGHLFYSWTKQKATPRAVAAAESELCHIADEFDY